MKIQIAPVIVTGICALLNPSAAIRLSWFSRGERSTQTISTGTQLNEDLTPIKADDFLTMPQTMITLGRLSKRFPIEYRPIPLLVGTKQEIDQLRAELQIPGGYPHDMNPNATDDHVLSIPLSGTLAHIERIRAPSSTSAPASPTAAAPAGQTQPLTNRSGKVSLDELLPLLRTHPIPTLAHDEPELVLGLMRLLIGPKPKRTPKTEPTAEDILPAHMQNLIRLATRNPQLVRTLAAFDPNFISDLVNSILGIDHDEDADKDKDEATGGDDETHQKTEKS